MPHASDDRSGGATMNINWRRHCWSYCLRIEGDTRRHARFPSPELRPARFFLIVDLLTTRVIAKRSQRRWWERCQREQQERNRQESLSDERVLPFPGPCNSVWNPDSL
jgi:hypothetical protein